MTVLLDTTDLGEAEAVLSATYTKQRFSTRRDAPIRARVIRSQLGTLVADDISFDFDLDTQAEPLADILLCRIRSGAFTQQFPGGRIESCVANEVTASGALADVPFRVTAAQTHYDVLTIDRGLLSRVAAGPPGLGEPVPVRLTNEAPVSVEANAHLIALIDHVTRSVLTQPLATESPLVASAVQQYLAATMLATFPNTALLDPTIEDRHDSTLLLLRRAMAFIDDNADRDISLADIADEIHITPRGLQYMFRRHLDCTPMDYLRRVRLHHAHEELLASDRMRTTVGQIAARWGFAHAGRFAVYYRQMYGQSPHTTFRSAM
ncbi:helix-turn-helix domain-containing protein [Mycolicibacterium moriokaense]|nr:helix-turn-helix domain-containing protein [Mycolicibacterium moriokaense]